MNRLLVSATWCLMALGIEQSLLAETCPLPKASSAGYAAAPAPFNEIGALVGKQYSGDGLSVVSVPKAAMLRCPLQRLIARVSAEGLWLVSTVDGARGEPFR